MVSLTQVPGLSSWLPQVQSVVPSPKQTAHSAPTLPTDRGCPLPAPKKMKNATAAGSGPASASSAIRFYPFHFSFLFQRNAFWGRNNPVIML
jgi:hypothetical protein